MTVRQCLTQTLSIEQLGIWRWALLYFNYNSYWNQTKLLRLVSLNVFLSSLLVLRFCLQDHGSYLLECVWNNTWCVKCQRIGIFAWSTNYHLNFTLQPLNWHNWCGKTVMSDLEGQIEIVSLLNHCQVSSLADVFFHLHFAKVEEMEKIFKGNRVNDLKWVRCHVFLRSPGGLL